MEQEVSAPDIVAETDRKHELSDPPGKSEVLEQLQIGEESKALVLCNQENPEQASIIDKTAAEEAHEKVIVA